MAYKRDIHIIITGGTLDKVHDSLTEGLSFEPEQPTHMDALLQQGRCDFPTWTVLMKIDSLDMTDAHREMIITDVMAAQTDAVIVTHGTGTMEQTAQYLAKHVNNKTVILTGAMRPFSLGGSDASFNVGGAIIAAQILPYGIYGIMNGRIFAAKDLQKNTKTGRFDR